MAQRDEEAAIHEEIEAFHVNARVDLAIKSQFWLHVIGASTLAASAFFLLAEPPGYSAAHADQRRHSRNWAASL